MPDFNRMFSEAMAENPQALQQQVEEKLAGQPIKDRPTAKGVMGMMRMQHKPMYDNLRSEQPSKPNTYSQGEANLVKQWKGKVKK